MDCYVHKKYDVIRSDPAIQSLFESRTSHGDAPSFFEDLSHGCALDWPLQAIADFGCDLQHDEDFMNSLDRQALPKYFGSRADETARIEAFVVATDEAYQRLYDGVTDDLENSREYYTHMDQFCGSQVFRVKSVLRSIVKQIKDGSCGLGELVWHGRLPLCDEAKVGIIDYDGDRRSELIFGLHLLFGRCTAFLWSGPDNNVSQANCRIQALKFAREVQISACEFISANEDEAYRTCVAFHPGITRGLQMTVVRLERYQKESVFDLYSQSPWVCGGQMSMILATV
jgi:hypothetical protein